MLTRLIKNLFSYQRAPATDALLASARKALEAGDFPLSSDYCRSALALDANCLDAHKILAAISLPGVAYTDVLKAIHRRLTPRTYVEVGVATGATIALAEKNTAAIGIDPEPNIEGPLGKHVRIFPLTSDEFFARYDLSAEFSGNPVDFAFIDGMHHFEFALRDFVAIERHATPRSVIAIHDTYPLNALTAERERQSTFWSGDIWRLVLALKKYRPDLTVITVAAPPTGLTLVYKLDPLSTTLSDNMDRIVDEFLAVDYSCLDSGKAQQLNLFPNDAARIDSALSQAQS